MRFYRQIIKFKKAGKVLFKQIPEKQENTQDYCQPKVDFLEQCRGAEAGGAQGDAESHRQQYRPA